MNSASRPPVSRRHLCAGPRNFLAFGFGAGLAPWAPGTMGSLAAVPFLPALHLLPPAWHGAALLAAFVVGINVCAAAAKSLGVHDHPAIVWDEMVGLWVTLCWLPLSPATVLLGFVLFRLFDIVKPWPISLIDRRVGGGSGIMLDDVLAGVFANLALRAALPYWPL